MTWRYVAARRTVPADLCGEAEEIWDVREYYVLKERTFEDGTVWGGPMWTMDAMAPQGDTYLELCVNLGQMIADLESNAEFLGLDEGPDGEAIGLVPWVRDVGSDDEGRETT